MMNVLPDYILRICERANSILHAEKEYHRGRYSFEGTVCLIAEHAAEITAALGEHPFSPRASNKP